MLKGFIIFLTIAFGVMLFLSIQNKLPPELEFLKADASVGVSKPGGPLQGPGIQTAFYDGWTVRQGSGAVELTKAVQSPDHSVRQGLVGILCDHGQLDMRLDPGVELQGRDASLVTVEGLGAQQWAKSKTTDVFPPAPAKMLNWLLGHSVVRIKAVSTSSQQLQMELSTAGLEPLVKQLPVTCQ